MTAGPDRPQAGRRERALACRGCGAPLAADQRYCLACGARHGPPSPALAAMLDRITTRAAGVVRGSGPPAGARPRALAALPSPRAGAVLVLGLLAFGVVIGAAAGSRTNDTLAASVRPPLRIVLPAPAPAPAAAPTSPSPPPVSATPTPAAGTAAPAATPKAATGSGTTSPSTTGGRSSGGSTHKTTTNGSGNTDSGTTTTGTGPAQTTASLPPIKHVFVVMLADQPYAQAFGPSSAAPYLARTLAPRGELLPRYYAVAHDELANEIALVSGQAPTPQTALNCPVYADVPPAAADSRGLISGQGCVYPHATPTVADQLVGGGRTWRVYAEGMDSGAPPAPASCRHPAPGAADPTMQARPGDAYATFRNPFAYFHSLVDAQSCPGDQVGLGRLAGDLASARTTPALSYIAPSLCHDGRDAPCPAPPVVPGQAPPAPPASGLPAADGFLRAVVPSILGSPGYRDGGLLVVTFDQAPASGPAADSSSCCGQPAFPTTARTGRATPGGGQVGALLLSPFVKAGSVDQDPYNHFSLLRTIEDAFGLVHLGYAGAAGVASFDATVFGAYHPRH